MSPMIFIFTYKKLNNTYRDVVIDPSKTEEFTPLSHYYFTDNGDGFLRLTQPETFTHLRVWDVENNGWRTLIKSRITNQSSEPQTIQRQNGVDYEEEMRKKDMETLKRQADCWEYYKRASSDFEWYKDNRIECKRVFEDSMNGHLTSYIDDDWMEKGMSVNNSRDSFEILYQKMDGSFRSIKTTKNDMIEFRAKIADKNPERYKNGMTHTRVWDIENEGWRTLNNNNIISTVA